MLGPILFAVFFLLISDKGRAVTFGMIGGLMAWVEGNRPFSYMVLAGMAVAALVSFVLVNRWPGVPEPDNPLAQYKRDHPEME